MARKATARPRKRSKPLSQKRTSASRRWLWIAIGAALALMVALVGAALINNRDESAATQATAGSTLAEQIGQPIDGRIMGSHDAPVLIEAYEDYQCPHCQEFNRLLEDVIRNDLVASGKARFQFINRFVVSPESIIAAEAAECALDQGRFWEYHDVLFEALRNSRAAVRTDNLKKLAAEIGLDEDAFNQCLDSRKHYEALLREDAESMARGVNATPTIFINGVQYRGPFDPVQFKAAVEEAAKRAGL
ncbi:MAG: thioredoxin domain-containing protein [Chloroflexi bacterium]|nr:thioredoxin domain-containing protein [Chloroflexota bacterium]